MGWEWGCPLKEVPITNTLLGQGLSRAICFTDIIALLELAVHQAPNPLRSTVNKLNLVSGNQSSGGSSSPRSERKGFYWVSVAICIMNV